jgi:formiminoglutamase
VSVPHAGLRVPAEVESVCALSRAEIEADSDGGAGDIYAIGAEVGAFVTTDIARAVLDVNRARDDRRLDGVVKTHTSYKVGVWRRPLSEAEIEGLLDAYYAPYHGQLTGLSLGGRWPLGVDCHTMAAVGPPVGPDPGCERPWVCVSNADGTCPEEWIETLREGFQQQLDGPVRVNDPFRGGYISRSHSAEMPWAQIELSREDYLPYNAKRQVVLTALQHWAERHT